MPYSTDFYSILAEDWEHSLPPCDAPRIQV
uniref:Uncharacterized protein n=1 Tax=Picea glauca TaxID=3330 RepID=A0A101M0Z3_PICGL|nr:hypothetical protein ABT39_MTgene4368 [Picea glauca]